MAFITLSWTSLAFRKAFKFRLNPNVLLYETQQEHIESAYVVLRTKDCGISLTEFEI
jgi:hypothetical protein